MMMAKERESFLKLWISRLADNKRASILIIALWSLFLLSFFALVLNYGARQKIILIQRLNERAQLRLIAAAGIQRGIAELTGAQPKGFDSLKDSWSNNASGFKDIAVGIGRYSLCYNYINRKTGALDIRYGITDEESKININSAGQDVLGRLFQVVLGLDETQAQEFAACIVDWRDSDIQVSIPSGSAEDPYYQSLGFPYDCKDAPFEVLDELLLVKGFDKDIFEKIKGYITIYGDGRVNINTATAPVLLALGLNNEIVDKILLFRCGKDGIEATEDDNVFMKPMDIVPVLNSAYGLSDSEISLLNDIVGKYITTVSNNFMIRSLARLARGRNTKEALCVLNRGSKKILYWRQF